MLRIRSVLLALVATAGASAANAADYGLDPIYDSPMFNFEGFYAGVQGGGAVLTGPGVVGVVGVVAGANFSLTDAVLAGLEFQGEGVFNGTGYLGLNALLLGRVGTYLTQDIMVYGAVGGGVVNNAGSYAFGAGLEMPFVSQLTGRAEVLGTGTWGGMPNGAKGTVGLLWHLN